MSEHPKPCRWVNHDQPRMLRTHLRDCEDAACEGCEPCPERHCGVCGIRHVERLTCPACVGVVRDDLGLIETLAEKMLPEAVHRGVNSVAAMFAGPCADHGVAMYRRKCKCPAWTCPDMQDRIGPTCEGRCAHPSCRWLGGWTRRCPTHVAWEADNRDELHPLYVLGTWDMLITEHYGHGTRTQRITVESAVQYLGANLTDLAQDPGFAFEELAREVRSCRGHMEDVLHDGEREDRGAPCPMCGAGALVKQHGEAIEDDRWVCPRRGCGASYTEHDYRIKVEAVYVLHADRLTASQIAETYRVPEGTIRQWAARDKVRRYGTDAQGRALYDVADVVNARDGVPA